jgi:outer membrane protein assembly factor BamB
MRVFPRVVAGFFVALFLASDARSESWSGFRGTAGDAVSSETGLPLRWSEKEGLAWSLPLRGAGNSSPAVIKDRVYVTASQKEDNSLWVIAVDRRSGVNAWEKKVGQGTLVAYGPPTQIENKHDPATASPCADDDGHVYAFFGTGDLVCLDRDGNEVWRRNLADEYGPYDLKFGMGSSPRLWGDRLYIACIHKGPSYVLALDKKTGKEVWLAERNYPGLGDAPDAYTSPVVFRQPGRPPQLIVSGCEHTDAYDMADVSRNRRLWYDGNLILPDSEYGRTVLSAAVGDGVVFASSSRSAVCIAIRGDAQGNVANTQYEVWKIKGLSDCPTPTIHGGIVYMIKDDGVGAAIDLKDGKELWKKRIGSKSAQSSPVVADGRVYFLSLDGLCTVVKAGREFELLAENKVPDGNFFATPAISNGMIILRERSKLYAVGKGTVTAAK